MDREHAALMRLVHQEIRKYEASAYWRGVVTARLASEDDFDRKKMVEDYALRFTHLHRDVIRRVVDERIYVLHLR